MGKVITGLSMSLDGFIAGPGDDVGQVFAWYAAGETDHPVPGSEMVFKLAPASIKQFEQAVETTGAIVYGRHTFDVSGAWGGTPPMGVPCVILTHNVPQEWVYDGSPFIFVTDGIASAIEQAKAAAGDRNVAIGSATTTQQCLNAGLLDEIHIDLVPVLLGGGVRLFDQLAGAPIELESTAVVEGTGVTH